MGDKPVAAGKSSFDLIDKEKLFAVMDVVPDSRFLDLACGPGRYSLAVASRLNNGGTVYAVDLWREGIEALDHEIHSRGLRNIKTMVADIRHPLPFDKDSIDSCLMATILHDLAKKDQKASLREIGRLLKAGGMLHIIEFKKIETGPGPPFAIRMEEKEIDALVAPFGFTKVTAGEVGEFNYMVKYRKADT
jgi:ubiquinone/menaquinone biosynthesis C-methylase UbiE